MSTPPGATPLIEKYKDYTDADAQLLGLPGPGAMNYLAVFSKQMQGTPFLPRGLGENPATILAVVLTGREMQLSPMHALRSFWLSPDGRLGMYADAMMACMRKAGFKFKWLKYDREGCALEASRPDGESFTTKFTVEDAKAAGLFGKDKSPWPKYPDRMCKARCIGDVWRTLASDLGGGQVYTQEEIVDLEADERGEYGVRDSGGGFSSAEHAKAARERKDESPMGDYKVELKPETPENPGAAAPEPAAAAISNVGNAAVGNVESAPAPRPAIVPVREPKVHYELYCWTTAGWNHLTKEGDLPSEDAAVLRAQALTNTTRVVHKVVRAEATTKDTARTDVATCKVPAAPAAPAEKPAEAAPAPAPAPSSSSTVDTAAIAQQIAQATQDHSLLGQLRTRIKAIHKMTGMESVDTANVRLRQFFCGYFGVGVRSLPKMDSRPEEFVGPISALEAVLAVDPKTFNDAPEQCGARCKATDDGLEKLCELWGWEGLAPQLAYRVIYRTQNTAEGFAKFITSNFDPKKAGNEEAQAFLALRLVSNSAPVWLAKAWREKGISMAEGVSFAMNKLGRPLVDCTESRVEAAIKEYLDRPVAAEPSKPEPGDAAEPPIEDTPADADDFLFGGGE